MIRSKGMLRRPDLVGDIIKHGALDHPDRLAIKLLRLDAAPVLRTYAELDERSTRLANALLDSGIRPGDRVAAWMEDAVEYVELYFAAAKAGFVVVPINPGFRLREAQHMLSDSGAVAIFFSSGLEPMIAELGSAGPRFRVSVGEGSRFTPEGRYDELIAAGGTHDPVAPSEDSALVLGYTSGTSGAPKGAMLSHRALRCAARNNVIAYRLERGGTCLFNTTMAFVTSVAAFIMPNLYVGATIVMVGALDADEIVAAIDREQATFAYAPSPRVLALAVAVQRAPHRVSSLKAILHGGSKVPSAHLRALADAVGPRLVEAWGMTENCGAPAASTTWADYGSASEVDDLFESVGRALPEVEIQIVSPRREVLPRGRSNVGEIRLRSPALMNGYWNRPEANESALSDGWFYTGDIGSMDHAGYLYVSDRRDDLIVSGGLNVYPSEVEGVIAELDGVRECAVVGAPHGQWGTSVVAVVVRADPHLTESDVINHCRRELAPYKKPTRVIFVDELPRNHNQKVLRRELRKFVEDAHVDAAEH